MHQKLQNLALLALLVLTLSACGQKEREELKAKVAALEQQLATAHNELAEKDTILKEARGSIDASGATLTECVQNNDGLKDKVRKLEIERDKLRAELKSLKSGKKR